MRPGWAIVAGLVLGIGAAWWLSRDSAEASRDRRQRAEHAAAENARDAVPALYRWHDDAGVLQVTEAPPKGRRYERIDRQPRAGIEVHGDRR